MDCGGPSLFHVQLPTWVMIRHVHTCGSSNRDMTDLTRAEFHSRHPLRHSGTSGHRSRSEWDQSHTHNHEQGPAAGPAQGTLLSWQRLSGALWYVGESFPSLLHPRTSCATFRGCSISSSWTVNAQAGQRCPEAFWSTTWTQWRRWDPSPATVSELWWKRFS